MWLYIRAEQFHVAKKSFSNYYVARVWNSCLLLTKNSGGFYFFNILLLRGSFFQSNLHKIPKNSNHIFYCTSLLVFLFIAIKNTMQNPQQEGGCNLEFNLPPSLLSQSG